MNPPVKPVSRAQQVIEKITSEKILVQPWGNK